MPNPLDPRVQAAYNKVKQEMPNIQGVNVSPTGSWFDRFMMPRDKEVYASTNPFTGNITYNSDMMSRLNDEQLQTIMSHELTHSNQAQNTPWYQTALRILRGGNDVPSEMHGTSLDNPYYWNPNEAEAFTKSRQRLINKGQSMFNDPTSSRGDIYLPPTKGINTAPSKMR